MLAERYFKSDDSDLIIKMDRRGVWYRFDLRKKEWVFDPDKAGIFCGKEPDYTEVSASEGEALIERIKSNG